MGNCGSCITSPHDDPEPRPSSRTRELPPKPIESIAVPRRVYSTETLRRQSVATTLVEGNDEREDLDDPNVYVPMMQKSKFKITAQSDSKDLSHQLICHLFDGHNAPFVPEALLRRGLKVLDVGCGSGNWVMEMADAYPLGEFVGLDVRTGDWDSEREESLSNLKFVRGNVLKRLPFEDNTFDYVHQQHLLSWVPEGLCPYVIAELTRVLKPGGYIDLIETPILPTLPTSSTTRRTDRLTALIGLLFSARRANPRIALDLAELASEDDGLFDVRGTRRCAAVGWAGSDGDQAVADLWKAEVKKGLWDLGKVAAERVGVKEVEWKRWCEEALGDCEQGAGFMNAYRVSARKRL
ncbi:S-adenosyl-L-methionine-dependent methyltransferase [Cladochytrium replicatum]|nr:S-adenosyl-L-methionine-dependent methyltransferase [Cladochytrium replicatum]